jgi:hypothetical protein
MADRSFVDQNTRERERLRALVQRLGDDDLGRKLNEHWTVAAVLAHVAFWDARALFLAERLERGVPFTASEHEPDDPSWINDSARPLAHAIAPREAARLALRLAEETDERIAALPAALVAKTWPSAPDSPLNPLRAAHRAEHLDEIEAALGR